MASRERPALRVPDSVMRLSCPMRRTATCSERRSMSLTTSPNVSPSRSEESPPLRSTASLPMDGTPGSASQLLDGGNQQVGLEGLDDPALGAGLLGTLHQGRLPLRREHHDGYARVGTARLDLFNQLEAAFFRHVDVADHGGDVGIATDLADAVFPVHGFDHVEPG